MNRVEIDSKGSNDHPYQWAKMYDAVEANSREPHEVIMANTEVRTMSYAEAVSAKEAVEALDFSNVFEDNEILDFVRELPLNERAVIAAGSFYRSYGSYCGLQFMMPATKDLLQFDLEELESDSRTGGVIVTIGESTGGATQYGFCQTETTKTIRTGRFK